MEKIELAKNIQQKTKELVVLTKRLSKETGLELMIEDPYISYFDAFSSIIKDMDDLLQNSNKEESSYSDIEKYEKGPTYMIFISDGYVKQYLLGNVISRSKDSVRFSTNSKERELQRIDVYTEISDNIEEIVPTDQGGYRITGSADSKARTPKY